MLWLSRIAVVLIPVGEIDRCFFLLIADAGAGPPTTLSELLLCKDADMYCINDEYDLDSEDGTDGSCWGFEDYLAYEDDEDVDITDADGGEVI
jgi:hypothetical protein